MNNEIINEMVHVYITEGAHLGNVEAFKALIEEVYNIGYEDAMNHNRTSNQILDLTNKSN
jgi:hypothetical protein